MLAAIVAAAMIFLARTASADTTYTYTDSTTGQTTTWSSGTDWTSSAAPVSAATTDLTFFSSAPTLVSGFTNTSDDDIFGTGGLFSLNILNLNGTGPSSGTAATINIATLSPSAGLDFDGTGTGSDTINLTAGFGTKGLTYNVTAPITLGAATTFTGNGSAAFIFSGGISGNFGIIKTGTSTTNTASKLTLSGPNTYTGGTAVNNGKLIISNSSGSVTGTGAVTVGNQVSGFTATLAMAATTGAPANATISGPVTVNGPGSSGKAATIAAVSGSTLFLNGGLTMNSGSNASFTLGAPNGTGGPALIVTSGPSNSLVANGGNGVDTINFSSAQIGTYDLISYTGSTNFGAFSIGGGSITAGFSYTLLSGSGQIDLQVSAVPVIWSGASGVNSLWDMTTQNWVNASGGATTYANPGAVTFGDTYSNGTGNPPVASTNVSIQSGGVTPSAVTFSNTAVNYTLSDADLVNGIGGSASIVKNGTGTVTFMSPNQFTGAVSVNAGQLNIRNGGALGSSAGVTISSGAALQLQGGITVGNIPLSISGAGLTGNANGALQSVSGANTYGGLIQIGSGGGTITSSSTSGGDGLTLTGGLNPQGNALTINGPGNTTISTVGVSGSGTLIDSGSGSGILTMNAASTFSGGVTLSSGTLRVGVSSSPSSGTLVSGALGTGTVTLNGGTLQDNGSAITLGNSISLNGSVTFSSSGSGSLIFDGTGLSTPATFNIAGNSSLAVNNTSTINDAISGSSNLAVGGGTGTLILGGANPFTGGTTINAGGLVQLNNTNALQNSVVTLNTPGGLTFQSGIGGVALGGLSGSTNLVMTDLNASPNPVALTLGNSNSAGSTNASYSGNLTSTTTLTKVGTNTQTLTGNNSFSAVAINNGMLSLGPAASGAAPLGTAPITLSGGTLQLLGQIGTSTLSGFGGTSTSVTGAGTGWTVNNTTISSNPINSNVLTLTDGIASEARSAFYPTPIAVGGGFTASFNYQPSGTIGSLADGAAFVLQEVGPTAIGAAGGSLGYTNIANPSAAAELNIFTGHVIGGAVVTNGANGTYTSVPFVDSGDLVNVQVTYNSGSSTLSEVLTDESPASANYLSTATLSSSVNLLTLLGTNTAYVGFTGGDGSVVSTQKISSFSIAYPGISTIANYANNLTLTGGATATIDVSVQSGLPTVSMGTLQVNNGSGTTLNVTAASALAGQPYGLTLGSVSLLGNVTLNVANNTNGSDNALGTLTLGALNDNGTARTITLGGAGAVTLNSAATSLVSGTVVNINNGTLNSNATGALGSTATVNVANGATFSAGATQTVSALNTVGAQATGQAVIGSGASLTVGSTDNLNSTFNGVISGAGTLVKSGTGTLTLTGANTYAAGTIVNNGTLAIGPSTATPLSTGLVTLSGGTLALQGQKTGSYTPGLINNYYIAGSNGIPAPNDVNNTWSVFNSQASIASTFNPLTPQYSVPSSTNVGGPALTTFFYGGNDNSPLNNFTTNSTGGGNTNGNVLNGGGGNGTDFTVISTGNVNIPTTGPYTFATTSDDGSMMFIFVNGAWQTLVNNNTFQAQTQKVGSITLTQGVYPIEIAYYEGGGDYLMSAQAEAGTFTSLPNTNDGGNVSSTKPSPLDLQFTTNPSVLGLEYGSLVLDASQTYANNVSVTSNSTINVSSSLTATMGNLTINTSTLSVASSDATVSPYSLTLGTTTLTGNATFNVSNSTGGGAGTLVLGAIGDSTSGHGITVTGTGTVLLNGVNTYTGNTVVHGGTLRMTGSLASGSAVTVGGANSSGTPTLSGSGTINGPVTVNAAGTGVAGHLAPSGIAGTTTTMNLAGGLSLASGLSPAADGPVLDFNLVSPTVGDLANVTGNLSLGANGILNINPFGGGGALSAGDYPLIDYTGSLTANGSASWTVGTHVGDSGNAYSFTTLTGTGPGGSNQFDLVVAVVTSGGSGTWISNISQLWSGADASNWSGGTHPDGATQFATFGTGSQTSVSINGSFTVGILNFQANTAYTLQAQGAGPTFGLTLNNSGGGAQVNIAASSSPTQTTLATSLVLADSSGTTTFNVNGPNNTLYIGSDNGTHTAISGSGQSLVLSGGGTLVLASPNTYSGTTTISANGGTLQILGPNGSIASTSVSVASGATLQLAGTTAALPSAANITTHGTGTSSDGAFNLTGTATQTVGVVSGDSSVINDSNSVAATVYSGNTTVGDGTNVASLTAAQILQNTLTINAGSTVTIAPSAGTQGGAIAANSIAASSASSAVASSAASADNSSESPSDPFTAIQAAIASGSISGATGQRLENRIAAIERLATTDPGLDVGLLESRILASLPSSSILSSTDSSPLGDSGSGLLTADSSAFGSSTSGAGAAFASAAGFSGSPAAVPEPSTLLLAALGGIGLALAARQKAAACRSVA